jgi:hypothetical protein
MTRILLIFAMSATTLVAVAPAACAHEPPPDPPPLCDNFCVEHSVILICTTKDACQVTNPGGKS